MIDDFIARVDREASAKATRRALQAGRPSSSAAPPESSADKEITGPSLLKAWAATAGQWLQARAHGRARPPGSSLSRGPSAFCTCVQVTWHRSRRWSSSHRPRSWLTQRLRSRHRQRLLRPCPRATSAATGRTRWRLQKPEPAEDAGQNQAPGPSVCSLPHGGEQGLASHWGCSSSVAPPAEASTVTAKPPSPVSSAAQPKASVAKPPNKPKGSVGAALSELLRPERLLPSLLPLQDRLSRRRRRRAPVVPPAAILLDVWVSRQEGARLVLRPLFQLLFLSRAGGLSRVALAGYSRAG